VKMTMSTDFVYGTYELLGVAGGRGKVTLVVPATRGSPTSWYAGSPARRGQAS
jgi:hypothetical protein